MISLLYHQWYGVIYLHAFSGTLVCVIVTSTAVHLFQCQWYVDESSLFISSVVRWYISFMPSVERWYALSSVVRWYISFIVSGTSMIYPFYFISGTVVYLFHAFSGTLVCVIVNGTAVHLFLRQWYADELSPFYIISGTVVYLFMPSVERWYVLSSVVRRYISFIVSGTSMNYLFLYHQWYGGISPSCLQWNVGMCYRQWYGGTSLSSSVVRR